MFWPRQIAKFPPHATWTTDRYFNVDIW
jgi:hypothetical protein